MANATFFFPSPTHLMDKTSIFNGALWPAGSTVADQTSFGERVDSARPWKVVYVGLKQTDHVARPGQRFLSLQCHNRETRRDGSGSGSGLRTCGRSEYLTLYYGRPWPNVSVSKFSCVAYIRGPRYPESTFMSSLAYRPIWSMARFQSAAVAKRVNIFGKFFFQETQWT